MLHTLNYCETINLKLLTTIKTSYKQQPQQTGLKNAADLGDPHTNLADTHPVGRIAEAIPRSENTQTQTDTNTQQTQHMSTYIATHTIPLSVIAAEASNKLS